MKFHIHTYIRASASSADERIIIIIISGSSVVLLNFYWLVLCSERTAGCICIDHAGGHPITAL